LRFKQTVEVQIHLENRLRENQARVNFFQKLFLTTQTDRKFKGRGFLRKRITPNLLDRIIPQSSYQEDQTEASSQEHY
jgi:hypothetical protein